MFSPWFVPRGHRGLWGKPPQHPALMPVYRYPAPIGWSYSPAPGMAHPADAPSPGMVSRTVIEVDEAIPAGVQVVARGRAARPPEPTLPDSRMAWSPDGRYLLYVAGVEPTGEQGPLMLLDLTRPESPRPVAEEVLWGGLAWHPDGQSFVYTGTYRRPDGRLIPTIYQQRLANGQAISLLPPEVADSIRAAFIHRWLDDRTLAFDEGVGTGIRRILLLDTATRRLFSGPELVATLFTWSPESNRLAGQYLSRGIEASFWLWDRPSNRFLLPPGPYGRMPLPGREQFFEAWSPDGRAALFTAWEGRPFEPGDRPGLYWLDTATGRVDRVADGAALAAWSDGWIAYVRWGPRLTLVMTRAADGEVLWTDDLGPMPSEAELTFPWTYWPRFAGEYVAYRTAAGEWRVSRADRKEVRPIYRGDSVDLLWSPDGRHIALLHTNETAYLTVVANPLAPVRAGRLPPARAAEGSPVQPPAGRERPPAQPPVPPEQPHSLPPGMTLDQALATEGQRVCLTGEVSVVPVSPPMDTPEMESTLLLVLLMKVPDYDPLIFLEVPEEVAVVDIDALIRALRTQPIRVCGTTQGIDPVIGPVLRVTVFPGLLEP